MSILVFDTETSGLPNFKLDDSDTSQPAHIVQLACILFDDKFKELASFYSLIKPELFSKIDPRAEQAHGINIEMCEKYGVSIKHALDIFRAIQNKATVKVAHNINFDNKMLNIDSSCIECAPCIPIEQQFCTMNLMTPLCKIPTQFGKFKWPKLSEAYSYCFNGQDFANAHDALADVRATSQIFKWLVDNGKVLISV